MQVYSDLFDDATPERMDALFQYLDKNGTGWCNAIAPAACRRHQRHSSRSVVASLLLPSFDV